MYARHKRWTGPFCAAFFSPPWQRARCILTLLSRTYVGSKVATTGEKWKGHRPPSFSFKLKILYVSVVEEYKAHVNFFVSLSLAGLQRRTRVRAQRTHCQLLPFSRPAT